MGDYVGSKVLSEIWDVSQATITKWCREGKIPGAEQDHKGSPWRIPVDSVMPDTNK